MHKETLKATSTEQHRLTYIQYRNKYNSIKQASKQNYYKTRAVDFFNDSKKLWSLINEVIGKRKSSGLIIPFIMIDSIKTYTPKAIANEFAHFYSNLGQNLATKIQPGTETIQNYLGKIPRNVKSLVLRETSVTEIENLINKLPNKTSCGFDCISNVMLKKLSDSISFPLMMIFNQSITMGKIPNKMKQAKIIPLFKGKEHNHAINYRPISLLRRGKRSIHTRVTPYIFTDYNV